jgi:threonylcarbamoyladenosine tRNA methylthiotransferase MtaB
MSDPRTFTTATLGCKVNQYETQYVKEMLESAGWVEAEAGRRADLCVVNTCTVTHEGDAKSRQTVRRLHLTHPNAELVVMGCFASRDPESVAALPGVNRVITDKERLVDELRPYGVVAPLAGISRFDGHQRAFVKVQDGCLLNCSYCIIPSVRPTVRSRAPEEIIAEVGRLIESGYREVVLTGIHLGHYGLDRCKGRPKSEWVRLAGLLRRLCRLPGDFRVRLSSLEAAEARDDLVAVLAEEERICPHLHLCLQSGSDRILAAMKRRYRSTGFLERCRRIRAALAHLEGGAALSTDVIVGFPGETEADFRQTLRVVREAGFMKVHVFPYSPRAGTTAAPLGDPVPPQVKAERRQRLQDLERELAVDYRNGLIGARLDVLVERAADRSGWVRGTTCRYAEAMLPGDLPTLRRQRVAVRITGAAGDVLVGEPVGVASPPVRRPLPTLAFPGEPGT